MIWQHWRNLLPCILCGQQRGYIQQMCQCCYTELPWQKAWIDRQQVHCFVACRYDFPIRQILQQFKDQAQLQYAPLLIQCLLTMPKPRVQAIVPMPISTEKLVFRGFNQSVELAKGLSKAWQLPIWQPIIHHHTHSQRGLSRAERLTNLQGQFHPIVTQCRYKHVLILDDVITTGASLFYLQCALQNLGCQHIQALCLCDAAS